MARSKKQAKRGGLKAKGSRASVVSHRREGVGRALADRAAGKRLGRKTRCWVGGRLVAMKGEAFPLACEAPTGIVKQPVVISSGRRVTDPRLPAAGSTILKTYKGRELSVLVGPSSFTFEGREYPSLSKIAREVIGGQQVNGFAFFGLVKKAPAVESAK